MNLPIALLSITSSMGLLIGCARPVTEAHVAIREVMAEQEAAWDRGDVRGFMQGYADTACFITAKGTTCGRQAVTDKYLRSYPDREAMGDLTFVIGEIIPLGPDHAWCTGTWSLARNVDNLSGGFTLLWVRTAEGWRIARDHTY